MKKTKKKPSAEEEHGGKLTKAERQRIERMAQEETKEAIPAVMARLKLLPGDLAPTPRQRERMLAGERWRYTPNQRRFFDAMCRLVSKKWGCPLYVVRLALRKGIEVYIAETAKGGGSKKKQRCPDVM